MKRLAIYFFFDKDGKGREYNFYYVKELKKISNYVLIVVNGSLNEYSKHRFNELANDVLIRENTGFDVWAYKEALEHLGWENIYKFDEIILSNFTCYGPIYPFSEMFSKMEQRTCDFWGAAKHPEQKNYLLPDNVGWIHEHIMSYFIVVRKNMMCHASFKEYWDNLPEIKTKTESTAFHETVFTRHFEKLGFISDSFVDLNKYRDRCNNGSIFYADEFLIEDRCPLVKRRAFFFPHYDNILDYSDGHQAWELMSFIQKKTDYDVNMIWDDILETQEISDVIRNMQMYYTVDEICYKSEHRSLIILHINQKYQINIINKYIKNKEEYDIVYVINNNLKQCFFEKCKSVVKDENIFITDESIGVLDYLKQNYLKFSSFDYICIIDPYTLPAEKEISPENYYRHIIVNMILSKKFICAVEKLFDENPRLGVCLPHSAVHANYNSSLTVKNSTRREYISTVFRRFFGDTPECTKILSYDNAFWCRKCIIDDIISAYEKNNSITNEIMTCIIPYVAQHKKYYTVFIQSTIGARTTIGNMIYINNEIQSVINNKKILPNWSFRYLKKYITNDVYRSNNIQKKTGRVRFKEVKRIVKQYIMEKYFPSHIQIKKIGYAYLRFCELVDGRITFFIISNVSVITESYLECDIYKFYSKKELTESQTALLKYINSRNAFGAFFEVPAMRVTNVPIYLKKDMHQSYYVKWTGPISYNAIECKHNGLFITILNDCIHVHDKLNFNLNVLLNKKYSLKDKIIFIFEKFLCKKYILFSENMSGNDNAFELFKYSLQHNKNCYFIANKKFIDEVEDKFIKNNIIEYNSNDHILKILQSKLWITSFSLRYEMFPSRILKDIHYYSIPSEWFFVPHGMAVGDKDPIMCHKYSWDRPAKTFCCNDLEVKQFSERYEFHDVHAYGDPRMDKWANAVLDKNKILLFFTWRFSLSNINHEQFIKSDYYKNIIDIVNFLHHHFNNSKIYYVFHHEIVKNGFDKTIMNALSNYNLSFIYYNTTKGACEFNTQFRASKYLITDYSSVAYDFAYKDGAIPIYYLEKSFISGHYPVLEKFYSTHLGVITRNLTELQKALHLEIPSKEMMERRKSFYKFIDGNNSERVFKAIMPKGE